MQQRARRSAQPLGGSVQRLRHAFLHLADIFRSVPVPPAVLLPPGSSLLEMPQRIPLGFSQGLEILNDSTTPMAFVVGALQDHIGLNEKEAIRTMVEIHSQGGVLIPMESLERAVLAATAIAEDALKAKHSLSCRAVSLVK